MVAAFTEASKTESHGGAPTARAYVIRSAALASRRRFEDAAADAAAASNLGPGDVDTIARAYRNREAALGSLGYFDEAIGDATAATELEPSDADTIAPAYLNRSFLLW